MKALRERTGTGLALCALSLGACSNEGANAVERAAVDGDAAVSAPRADGARLLNELRQRYRLRPPAQRAARSALHGAAQQPSLALKLAAPRAAAPSLPEADGPQLLPRLSSPAELEAVGEELLVKFAGDERPSAVELALPARADGVFRARDRATGVGVAARIVGARDVAAELADGYVIYRAGTAQGATLIQRSSPSGSEDYVEFSARPATPELEYELELDASVAGLRLVGNSLEALDASGAPRLHVPPPYLATSNGALVPATLAVEGCSVDHDPSAPWDRPPIAPGAGKCRLIVRWEDSELSYPALLDPGWATTAKMSAPRMRFRAALLPSSRVLVAGGVGLDGVTPLDSAELYNPSTRSWATTASMRGARTEFTLTRRADGRVVAAGGYDVSYSLRQDCEAYEATSGTWSAAPPLLMARAYHEAELLNNGDVLIAGGTSITAERLAAQGGAAKSAADLPAYYYGQTLTVLKDGRALLVGGTDAVLYDPNSNKWSAAAPTSGAYRAYHSATRLTNGQVLIVGGSAPSAELYDPSSNSWSRPGGTLEPLWGHTATLLNDGRVLISGAVSSGRPAALSTELYSPTWGTFAPGPALARQRVDHEAMLLSNGRVLVAGGSDVNGAVLDSAEEFDPASAAVTISEYKLPASVDPTVLDDRATELWAAVIRPRTLAANKRYPLLVFLHGNHGTCGTGSNPRRDWSCDYTYSGTCPQGYVVTPNHRGYDYVASELAAQGFIVVSINANRGITCGGGTADDGGLNLARGRLVLRHLQALSEWNRGVASTPASLGASLSGKLDFSQVGFLGHSRGGEGVRAAYEQYRDPGSPWPARLVERLDVRAIFEIGPVDGQTSRVLNADGTAWNVLLPVCDGDVSDLEGVRPFDRMLNVFSDTSRGAKSTYTVWGANHNFYNTEWQETDSGGCTDHRALFSPGDTGSAEQRQTGVRSIASFFLSHVGDTAADGRAALADLFNPEALVSFDSPVQRGYSPAAAETRVLEDFLRASGTSSAGFPNLHSRVSVVHGNDLWEHDQSLRIGTISWTQGGSDTYFQTNLARQGTGVDVRAYQLLDFRVDRPKDALNSDPETAFTVALVNADGTLSDSVDTQRIARIDGPPGGPYNNAHEMFSTLRIPLAWFYGADLRAIRGVRFTFDRTASGVIHLANVRLSRSTRVGETTGAVALSAPAAQPASRVAASGAQRAVSLARRVTTGNAVVSLKTANSGRSVELELSTGTAFVPHADLLVLDVAGLRSSVSRHPNGNLSKVVFSVDKAEFDAIPDGETVRVRYQKGFGNEWEFGSLDKSRLNK